MSSVAEVPASPTRRRPWWPTSLGFATLVVTLIAWRMLSPLSGGVEPRAAAAPWPQDEPIAASLRSFLGDGSPAASPPPAPAGFHRGIALGLYSQSLDYDYGHLIDEIADHRADWISLFFNMYQEDRSSTAMNPPTRLEDQEALILRAAAHAHRRGLRVMAFPLVLLRKAGPREWRGNIEPANLDDWFANYTAHLIRLARACESAGVEALCVGSEFSSLEQHADHWRRLIASVREAYSGTVLYSANWDHYDEVHFWDAVDAVGLSGYYELTRTNDPALGELTAAWGNIRDEILAWRGSAAPDRPILFTEIGYANLDGTNVYPWNYTMKGAPDPREQALCYEAFIRSWAGRPEFGGVYFYNWFGTDSPDDTGYSPRGKPASHLIRVWYEALARENPRGSGS